MKVMPSKSRPIQTMNKYPRVDTLHGKKMAILFQGNDRQGINLQLAHTMNLSSISTTHLSLSIPSSQAVVRIIVR